MNLKIKQVFDAVLVLDTIIKEKRPMPQIGKFRLARMHGKLLPEFAAANAQRDELIAKHGELNESGAMWVPPARLAEFNAEWEPLAEHEVEVDIEPIKLSDLLLGDSGANGGVEASELIQLGDLITE